MGKVAVNFKNLTELYYTNNQGGTMCLSAFCQERGWHGEPDYKVISSRKECANDQLSHKDHEIYSSLWLSIVQKTLKEIGHLILGGWI